MSNGKINGANMLALGVHGDLFVQPTVQASKVKFVKTVPSNTKVKL